MKLRILTYLLPLAAANFIQAAAVTGKYLPCDTISICSKKHVTTLQTFYKESCQKKSLTRTKRKKYGKFKDHYKEWDEKGHLVNHYRSCSKSKQIGPLLYAKIWTWRFRKNGKICLRLDFRRKTEGRKPWK